MQGIHIVATGSAVPKKVVTNDDLSKIVDTNDEWIKTRTGISRRYVCGEGESCSTLAIEAARKAVESAGVPLEEIGSVVVATASSDYAFPSTACLVQKALGLPKDTMSFDISAACSGFLYGLKVCKGLLSSGKKYSLLIGSEHMTRLLDFTDRSTCVLFGDGAGAAVLELDDSLFVHKAWSDGNAEVLSCKGAGCKDAKIFMDGKEVFKFAVKVIRQGIDAVLEEAGLTMDDIDYVVCHQANERIIENVSKRYAGSAHKFYLNIADYANTSAASIPIALDGMMRKGLLKRGMKVITVGFGAGFTWSSALMTI